MEKSNKVIYGTVLEMTYVFGEPMNWDGKLVWCHDLGNGSKVNIETDRWECGISFTLFYVLGTEEEYYRTARYFTKHRNSGSREMSEEELAELCRLGKEIMSLSERMFGIVSRMASENNVDFPKREDRTYELVGFEEGCFGNCYFIDKDGRRHEIERHSIPSQLLETLCNYGTED